MDIRGESLSGMRQNSARLERFGCVSGADIIQANTFGGSPLKLAQYDLPAAPVFDGMAAAGGRLYVALTDGRSRRLPRSPSVSAIAVVGQASAQSP